MTPGQELQYKYSGLFQSVVVRMKCAQVGDVKTLTVSAEIKLPILKKNYLLSTDYKKDSWDWISHVPIHESGQTAHRVARPTDRSDVLDPVTFFMLLNEGEWNEPSINMQIGNRIVSLDVAKKSDGYDVKRHEKNQQIFARKDAQGIKAVEIPVPVLGVLSVKRV